MRVTEIILDGFKSYAVRTAITEWDESFNSITGLNGSGKSNILDAICFVLGITNMTTVRAQNLQDLIYKRGQAGVTKASVTIIFDNSDKTRAPIGYEAWQSISVTRQIMLGGASKFLLNGIRTQQHVIQTLFQGVGLNINNPNFLIMQGRVMKVLNMKSTEILAMIEEAAGTRMFEDRRDKAFKTMAKKDKKVEEIDELLKEEIDPKLDKLRSEKRTFLDFQQAQSDLERFTKLVVAHDYVKNDQRVQQSAADLQEKKARVKWLDDSAMRLKIELDNLAEDVKRVKAQRDREFQKGGKYSALEEEVKQKSHEKVRLNTVMDLKSRSLKEEKEKRKEVLKAVKDYEKARDAGMKAYEQLNKAHVAAKAAYDAKVLQAEGTDELLQELLTGVASREGQESGYQNQLQDAKSRLSAAETEQEQARLKINHLTKRIQKEEPRAEKAKQQNATLFKELEIQRAAVKRIETDLEKLGYEEGMEEETMRQLTELEGSIRDLTRKANQLRQNVRGMDFTYTDPSPDFDRSRVKGLVAQLFTLDEDKEIAGTALEICAGSRLYNVVVDTSDTASQLLSRGQLVKRVTIIPLNQINAFRTAAQAIATAQRIAPGKVDLALSLVGYDDEVAKAMEFVFGSTFICTDADTAKTVTFHPQVHSRSVTHEGDVYDPSGTLSGGSAPRSGGVLVTIQKINTLERMIAEETAKLDSIRETMQREKKNLDKARGLKRELELKRHEISLTEEQINSNSSSSIIQAVQEMRDNINQAEKDIVDAKKRQDEAAKEVKRIENDMNEFKNNKGGKLAQLREELDALKKDVSEQSEIMKSVREEFQSAQVEMDQVASDLASAQESLEDTNNSIKAQEAEVAQLQKDYAEAEDALEIAAAHLKDEKDKLSSFNEELGALDGAIRSKQARMAEEDLESRQLGHEVEKFHKETQASREAVARMEREHEWINDEREQFGRPGTPYDFEAVDIAECRASLKSLSERSKGMRKQINPKVMDMIDSVEKKEVSLKRMLRTVIKDKRKIEETIIELDHYKKEALERTHAKVSEDFGKIFAEMLPGSFAKLVAPEGKDIADGLEIRVQLGRVWKESLTELSGGQRSLIALSLIMALLQFKPAPMYILDEVDAALDLSHTQNIGRLIKTRFKGSQFIVVSLKEGMFQNANRIFKTRFVDGTSVVQAL